MHHLDAGKRSMIQRNRDEYGRSYDALSWITPDQAMKGEEERRASISAIRKIGEIRASETKMGTSRLSPGCRRCMEGSWSCLFINGICNGRCFYCPTSQNEVGEPTTNHLTFSSPDAYADYVAALGFTGMSITGGEPFLTFERSLAYIQAVRERVPGIHIWLYTNGTRVTKERLKRLAIAGLDEIRFDIGATRYTLKKAAMAQGIIPTVTVEIPMVPEEKERLKALLSPMVSAGISHLNLHQMRLTPHNIRHLAWKKYTFLHGDRVTILESELGALEIARHAIEEGIDLGVNYCSFVYKQRFQGAGVRSRAAEALSTPWETITDNGYIRRLSLHGDPSAIGALTIQLEKAGHAPLLSRTEEGLYLPTQILPATLPQGITCRIAYDEATLSQRPSPTLTIKKIPTQNGTLYAERKPRMSLEAVPAELHLQGPMEKSLESVAPWAPFEIISPGLLPYF